MLHPRVKPTSWKCKKCGQQMARSFAHSVECGVAVTTTTPTTDAVEMGTPTQEPVVTLSPSVPPPSISPEQLVALVQQQAEVIKSLQEKLSAPQPQSQVFDIPRIPQNVLNSEYMHKIGVRAENLRTMRRRIAELERLLPTEEWTSQHDIEKSKLEEEYATLDEVQRKESFIAPKEEVQVPESFRDLVEEHVGQLEYISMENDPKSGIFALYFVPKIDPSVRVIRAYHSEGVGKIKENLRKMRKYLLQITHSQLPNIVANRTVEVPRFEISPIEISRKTSDIEPESQWLGANSL